MSKRKETNKENEPDPVDKDEEELPPRKRVKCRVAHGAYFPITDKHALRICFQRQTPLWTRTTHMVYKLRPRKMIYLILRMGFGMCLAIW